MARLQHIVINAIALCLLPSLILLRNTGADYPIGVKDTLHTSGPNRSELERVLEHYRSAGDAEQYRAACFLVENMRGRYMLSGPFLDRYYSEMAHFYERSDIDYNAQKAFQDSLFASGGFFKDLERVQDARSVSAAYLMDRIESAFAVRNSPWAADLDIEEFCEYVLPYRFGTEELEPWWQIYREHFGPGLDSLTYPAGDLAECMRQFSLGVNRYFHGLHTYNGYPAGRPTPKPSSLMQMLGGTCDDSQIVYMAIARTYGIPVARDFTPQWGNHSNGHSWVGMVHKDSTYHCTLDEMARPARVKQFAYRLAKAYRWTESPYGEGVAGGRPRAGDVPGWLMNPRLKDVTGVYVDVTDVPVRLHGRKRSRYVLLSVFDDRDWAPLGAARRKGKGVTFRDVGYPLVLLPQYYKNGEKIVAGWPVLVDSTGHTRELIPDPEQRETVLLKRKFMDRRPKQFVAMLKGGRFELADNASFRDALQLAIPDTVGMNYQTLEIGDGRRYRYIRYLPPPGGTGDIAEIEVYGTNGTQLSGGKVIGTYMPKEQSTPMENVFDGATLTYAAHEKGQESPMPWLGLDLGRSVEISRLCYLPRTDDNFIREGEEYELCYWDGDGWSSLGRQIGSRATQELVYDNVPANALLLLHNHTKGKEERIFTYEDGRQVWW